MGIAPPTRKNWGDFTYRTGQKIPKQRAPKTLETSDGDGKMSQHEFLHSHDPKKHDISGWWWLEPWNFMSFHEIHGNSSSQLTNSMIFQRAWNHQPDLVNFSVLSILSIIPKFPLNLLVPRHIWVTGEKSILCWFEVAFRQHFQFVNFISFISETWTYKLLLPKNRLPGIKCLGWESWFSNLARLGLSAPSSGNRTALQITMEIGHPQFSLGKSVISVCTFPHTTEISAVPSLFTHLRPLFVGFRSSLWLLQTESCPLSCVFFHQTFWGFFWNRKS